MRFFVQVKGNMSSELIMTKVICKPWSSCGCVPLKFAWYAKCGTRAVGCRPLFYIVISPVATGDFDGLSPQRKFQSPQIEMTNTINQVFCKF